MLQMRRARGSEKLTSCVVSQRPAGTQPSLPASLPFTCPLRVFQMRGLTPPGGFLGWWPGKKAILYWGLVMGQVRGGRGEPCPVPFSGRLRS